MKKRNGVLTYSGTNIVPMRIERDAFPECEIVMDSFWEEAEELLLDIATTFESVEG